MLPNYTSFSTLSDQAYYSAAQASVPPLPSQITFESEPQLNELLPIQAASATTSMCQARKRTGRSDRHSKIRTAHGERDRRMRLSVQVAHQFFALQDRLGFDKASKTIDWLLTQAKDSIDQLSSTSSSELRKEEIPTDHSPFSDIEPEPVHATEIAQKRNKAVEGQQRSKDLRAKARERARERAREKKMVSCQLDQLVPAAISSSDALIDVDCNGMEYYYDLLNEILNGGFCSVDIEDIEGSTSAAVHFN